MHVHPSVCVLGRSTVLITGNLPNQVLCACAYREGERCTSAIGNSRLFLARWLFRFHLRLCTCIRTLHRTCTVGG